MPDIEAVKRLCRRVAPHELRGRPVYLHLTDGPGDGWAAFTHPALARLLRPSAPPGWAVVVRRSQVEEPLSLAILVVHELAHMLTWPAPIRLSPERLIFERWAVEAVLERAEPSARPAPDENHGPDWHRAAIHLSYRAQQAGWDIRPAYGLGIGWYGDFAPEEAVTALGDEPARMAGEAFRTILATPVPVEFLNLFSHEEVCNEFAGISQV